ncbi:unnamed protein product [Toxocara canis]|uniref:Uncharacterized protein n=1 Tax=Toxocara canis TaxID=6265 RepID=A0A183U120_TOXCA|nr:unnamed protein product [Toxocara canis]
MPSLKRSGKNSRRRTSAECIDAYNGRFTIGQQEAPSGNNRLEVDPYKVECLEQLRRDERKHQTRRSTPTPKRYTFLSAGGGTSLPNIVEAANEGSDEAGSPTTLQAQPANSTATLPRTTALARVQRMERRTPSSSVPSASTVEDQGSRSLAQTRSQQIFSFENGESRVPSTFKRTTPEAAQLSYVVGGTQTAFAEDVSSERSQQRQSLAPVTITANTAVPSRSSPLSESVQASSTASEHFNATPRGSYRKEIERQSSTHVRPSSEPIDAGALPRSILKQSTSVVSQDEYSANDLIDRRTAQDRCCEEVSQQIPHMPDVSSPSQGPHIAQFEAMHADRNTPFEMQSEEERFRIMQENLRRHRQRSLTPQHRYPQTSFNGPFFKLEEVSISQRPR